MHVTIEEIERELEAQNETYEAARTALAAFDPETRVRLCADLVEQMEAIDARLRKPTCATPVVPFIRM